MSRRRYNVGLLLLVLGNALLLGVAYVPYVLGMPVAQNTRLYLDLAGDVMIIVSFFVMGEQFWEKLKGLFNWEPEVSRLPSSHTAT